MGKGADFKKNNALSNICISNYFSRLLHLKHAVVDAFVDFH